MCTLVRNFYFDVFGVPRPGLILASHRTVIKYQGTECYKVTVNPTSKAYEETDGGMALYIKEAICYDLHTLTDNEDLVSNLSVLS